MVKFIQIQVTLTKIIWKQPNHKDYPRQLAGRFAKAALCRWQSQKILALMLITAKTTNIVNIVIKMVNSLSPT